MFIPSRFNQSRHITLYLLVILFLFSFVPKVAEAEEVIHPFAPAHQLADLADCATGPSIDLFVNTVLLTATSSGWSFRGYCGVVNNRPEALVVLFRDVDGLKYLAWYDSEFDFKQRPVYSGGFDLEGMKVSLGSLSDGNLAWEESDPDLIDTFDTMVMNLGDNGYVRQAQVLETLERQEEACRPSELHFFCTGKQIINVGREKYVAKILFVDDLEGNGLEVEIKRDKLNKNILDVVFPLAVGTFITVASFGAASEIGIAFALSEASTAAIAGGLGGFGTALALGQDIENAFLQGLAGATIAYVAQVGLDKFGDPFAMVGAEGKGCPTGDQCWALQLAAKLPPIQRLAEFHDPFIVWSETALGTIGSTAWYKAVTIPPFVVPGCAASSACVTTGLLLVDEKELL